MPRARKMTVDETENLPIRATSRKRKLVDYKEVDDVHEVPGVAAAEEDTTVTVENGVKSARTTRKARNAKTKVKASKIGEDSPDRDLAAELSEEIGSSAKKNQSKTKYSESKTTPGTQDLDELEAVSITAHPPSKVKRKRKTKEEKEREAMPLAARTVGLKMFVGAHTSIAKGLENAIHNSVRIGGNAFACFLRSQRKWENPELQDGNRDAFKQALIDHKYDGMAHAVPHGSYLVNLATEDEEMARKSYATFIDDLHRCEALGIRYYNFHPGAAGKAPFEEAITRLATNLNRALSETTTVVPLLENMATRGTIIGGRFSDLRAVIDLVKPEFKSRIGVCIDTCHAFASGYDLRTPEAFKKIFEEFDSTVGMQYLKALHVNDSKAPFASHRDLHQNIGLGFLGLRAFHNVMNEPRFANLPLILETPCERPDPGDPQGKKTFEDRGVWAAEIKLLESLIGMDPSSSAFKKLEKELSDKGKDQRASMQKQIDTKMEKQQKKLAKEREKQQKNIKQMFNKGTTKRQIGGSESPLSELSDDESD